MSTAVTFAFGAGLLATVNPCGFALLPSFLGFYLGADERPASEGWLSRAIQGFSVGLVLSAAFSVVFIFTGLVVSAGLRSVISVVPWFAVAIGGALAVLGVAMLAGRHVGLWSASRVAVRGGPGGYRRVAAFGATYAVASLSCTLGVFLVVVAQALAVGSVPQLLAVSPPMRRGQCQPAHRHLGLGGARQGSARPYRATCGAPVRLGVNHRGRSIVMPVQQR